MKDFITEIEAHKKFCPFTFTVARDVDWKPDDQLCISARCMAWRWSHQDTSPADPPTGYCGAFGLPKYI